MENFIDIHTDLYARLQLNGRVVQNCILFIHNISLLRLLTTSNTN